jgi:hypothetical protein
VTARFQQQQQQQNDGQQILLGSSFEQHQALATTRA